MDLAFLMMWQEAERDFREAKRAYREARRCYEEKRAEADRRCEGLHRAVEEGRITVDEWAEKCTDIDYEVGTPSAFREVVEAENRLLEVGRRLLKLLHPDEWNSDLDNLFKCTYPHIRRKVVKALLELPAWDGRDA